MHNAAISSPTSSLTNVRVLVRVLWSRFSHACSIINSCSALRLAFYKYMYCTLYSYTVNLCARVCSCSFITFRPCEQLNGKHTVFGRLVGGLATLDAVERVPVDEHDKPKVRISSIQLYSIQLDSSSVVFAFLAVFSTGYTGFLVD